MDNHYHQHKSPLEISELAEFDSQLGDIPEDEKRKKRILYIKDAQSQLNVARDIFKSMGCVMIPFYIIPIFWPFLIFIKLAKKKSTNLFDAQYNRALEYWDIKHHDISNSWNDNMS